MINVIKDKLTGIVDTRFSRHRSQRFTDVHCHCLLGIDDGPATKTESLELCLRMSKEDIGRVVATPHQLGRFDGRNEAERIRQAVCDLNESLINSHTPLEVAPGGEVRVDERICQLLDADKILTLADSCKYVLLEFPHQIFIDIEPLIGELAATGIGPIIGHPEKSAALVAQSKTLRRWLEKSVHLQITAASLTGDLGPTIQKVAWGLLTGGWVSLIATDAHDVSGRQPRMKDAFNLICTKLGDDLAHLLCIENPLRVINGQDLQPVWLCDQREWQR